MTQYGTPLQSSAVVTAAAEEPVTLVQAKDQCRVTGTDHDTRLTRYIAAARALFEGVTRRTLVATTYDTWYDRFPPHTGGAVSQRNGEIELPFPPLSSITTIKYYDDDGVQQTLSSALYTVDTTSEPGRVVPAVDQQWPSTQDRIQAVEIRHVAGYANAAAVPDDIVHGLLLIIAHAWSFGMPVIDGQLREVPWSLQAFMQTAKVPSFV